MGNIIVGLVFSVIIGYGIYKSVKSIRNNSCPGCSGGCSEQQRKSCSIK